MKPPLAALFIFLLFSTVVQAGDEATINNLLKENAGGTCTLEARTYTISGQIIIPKDTTLQGTVSESGELLSKIVLVSDSTLKPKEEIFEMKSNTKFLYIDYDGNSKNQANVPWKTPISQMGQGYHNVICSYYADNIEIAYCNLGNSLGDIIRLRSGTNMKVHDNKLSRAGHESVFLIECQNTEVYNNDIWIRDNCGVRLIGGVGIRSYNNYIYYLKYDPEDNSDINAAHGHQIQNDGGIMRDIEITGNTMVNMPVSAFWVVGKSGNDEDVWIHDNVILNSGNGNGWGNAGAILSGFTNVLFENNVFDGTQKNVIEFRAYASEWATEAVATIKNNIFVDSTGAGINNQISAQTGSSSENCYYNTDSTPANGFTSSGDYSSNPRISPTLCNIKWDGEKWVIPGIAPRPLNDTEDYPEDPDPITDEELEEIEFIDFKNLEFSEDGYVNQSEIQASKKWESNGKHTTAYIFLAGYNGEITFNNQSFIPVPASECAIVKYDTKNLAPNKEGQTSEITLSDAKDSSLKVKLEVKTKYKEKKYKTYSAIGAKIRIPYWDKKSEIVVYEKTYPAPPQFPKIGSGIFNTTVEYHNSSYNPYTLVTVQENENQTQFDELITFVEYFYKGTTAKEFRQIGYVSVNASGFKRTHFKETNTWTFSSYNLSHSSRQLYIKGPLDLNSLEIMVHTPYNQTKVTDISYTEIRESTTSFFENMKTLFWIILFFAPFLFSLSSEFKIVFGRFRG